MPVLRAVFYTAGADCHRLQHLCQAKPVQHLGRVRHQVDTDTQRPNCAYGFKDLYRESHLVQAERRGQPADTSPGNRNIHLDCLRIIFTISTGRNIGRLTQPIIFP